RDFEHGRVDMVRLAGATAAQSTFGPGWRWSTDIKPVVGTDSCQAHHVGYCVSGSLHVVTDEGNEFDLGAGDVYEILPGHDAGVGLPRVRASVAIPRGERERALLDVTACSSPCRGSYKSSTALSPTACCRCGHSHG